MVPFQLRSMVKRKINRTPIYYQKARVISSTLVSKKVKLLRIKPENTFNWIPGQDTRSYH